ncbi:hypothetical protein QJS10_CPA01g03058 [Acorus calamus]|uniref:Uncharacterized protein n=1 Tax=Acorus calamus TaxID=4465 RepID=A0AAV9FIK6_ACOCL|nr:hypothetical protein QJS10_CPA01g03058 [Acorus calamus]
MCLGFLLISVGDLKETKLSEDRSPNDYLCISIPSKAGVRKDLLTRKVMLDSRDGLEQISHCFYLFKRGFARPCLPDRLSIEDAVVVKDVV